MLYCYLIHLLNVHGGPTTEATLKQDGNYLTEPQQMVDNPQVGAGERLSGFQTHVGGLRVGHVLTTSGSEPWVGCA